jgi:hypothetical protein
MKIPVIRHQLIRLEGRHYIHWPGPKGSASGFIVAPERYICANRSDSVRRCVSQMKRLTHTSQLIIDRKKSGRVIEPQTLLTLPEWRHFESRAKVILREGLLLVGRVGECSVVVLGISVRWPEVMF